MKNTLRRGSITLGLGLMLTTLCQGQQWSGESNLGGNFSGDPAVAQIPGTNILQVFYHGGDDAIWTQWRNPDGTWSDQQSLGGHLYVAPCTTFPNAILDFVCGKNASPSVVQIPGTNVLEVFYRGSDNHLRAFQRNANGWTGQDFGGALSGDPSATQVPAGNQIQVFYRGADGSLKTQWGNLNSWVYEQPMGGQLFGPTCEDPTNSSCFGDYATPFEVQIPGTNVLEVFYRGSDNHLRAFQRNANGWTAQDFGGTLSSNPTAVQVPGGSDIQVFYRGVGYQPATFNGNPDQGGHLMTQFGNLSHWVGEQQMPGKLSGYYCRDQPSDFPECSSTGFAANYDVPRAYQQPGTNNLWVFYRGQDGGILNYHPTIYAQERYADGTWSSEMGLGGNPDSNIIPSFVPGTNLLQLFYYANYCDFFSCWQYLGTMWYPN